MRSINRMYVLTWNLAVLGIRRYMILIQCSSPQKLSLGGKMLAYTARKFLVFDRHSTYCQCNFKQLPEKRPNFPQYGMFEIFLCGFWSIQHSGYRFLSCSTGGFRRALLNCCFVFFCVLNVS